MKAVWRCLAAALLVAAGAALGETTPGVFFAEAAPGHSAPTSAAGEPALAAEAKAIAEMWKKRLGPGYETRTDAARHIVFVSALDRRTFDYAVQRLAACLDAQRTCLFPEPLAWNLTVVLPTVADYRTLTPSQKALGHYNPATRTLVSLRLSDVLFHEFTHALHHNDQMSAGQRHPAWMIEGLAMLFQDSEVRDGRIEPRPGLGLETVQAAVREGKVGRLAALAEMRAESFASDAEAAYAHVRFVMLYLHEQGKLRAFYEAYKAGYLADRSGMAALEKVLGKPIEEVEKNWRAWVLALEPPWRPGRAPDAHLGVRMEAEEGGVRVGGFVRGSAAQRAGQLKVGDLIVSVGGRPTPAPRDLTAAVQACQPGETVEIEVIRKGQATIVMQLLGAPPGRHF
jgi:uncharacterized damage-inducible protein DinB